MNDLDAIRQALRYYRVMEYVDYMDSFSSELREWAEGVGPFPIRAENTPST